MRPSLPASPQRDRFRGCLLGGAVGDALGAAVEFMSLEEIHRKYGAGGIRDFDETYGRVGAITDDTQMTLFTAEGLLRSYVRWAERGIGDMNAGIVKSSYLRWLHTQGCPLPREFRGRDSGWLVGVRELHSRRAPGNTCIQALLHTPCKQIAAENGSKGCGGAMRVAPVALCVRATGGLMNAAPEAATFDAACKMASITHGHPTGQLAAGAFAVLVHGALAGKSVEDASDDALALLAAAEHGAETRDALLLALSLAADRALPAEAIPRLGEGWIAEEAVAIALYCTLIAEDFEQGVTTAVNINGDSDSTGSMTGNLLGALHGVGAIPPRWLDALELREVIEEVADDFLLLRDAPIGEYAEPSAQKDYWLARYPGN